MVDAYLTYSLIILFNAELSFIQTFPGPSFGLPAHDKGAWLDGMDTLYIFGRRAGLRPRAGKGTILSDPLPAMYFRHVFGRPIR